MKKLSLGILCIIIQLTISAQCLLTEVPLQQRNAHAQLVIEGRVTATRSFWNRDHTMIYSSNSVEVLKVFKGTVSTETVEVLTEGGTVGMTMIRAEPSLQLMINDVGLFFCQPEQRFKALPAINKGIPRYEAYSSVQGFIKYDLQNATASDPFNKYPDVENELYSLISPTRSFTEKKPFRIYAKASTQRVDAVDGFSPNTVTAGTATVLTITGTGFGAGQGTGTVGFKNGDDGGGTYIYPLPSQYVSWTDTEIKVEVPSKAGTGTIQVTQGTTSTSASPLTVNYSQLNVGYDPGSGTIAYPTDHVNDNGTGGYTWQMNNAFAADAAASSSFLRAFNTWRCGTGVNWTTGFTTIANSQAADGTNVISFDKATNSLPAGVLGTCYSYWTGCGNGVSIAWYVSELDIIFDDGSNLPPGYSWQYGPAAPTSTQYDFETVAVHELGHGHQLGHVINPGAIMHYAIYNGVANRALGTNDLAGGNNVQSRSVVANVCGPGPMTPYTGCSVLPIAINSIKAYQKNAGIQVTWTNELESNVDHYDVERSVDGIHFIRAASVSAKANNNTSASYEWYDQQGLSGDNFYRVKAIGFNEKVKYSEVVLVNLTIGKGTFSVYPNPVAGKNLVVGINNLDKGGYTLALYNNAGQLVMSKAILHTGANGSQSIALPKLASGIYQLQLLGNNIKMKQTVAVAQGD